MRAAEEIISDIFEPTGQPYLTYMEDVQLSITLNPSLELIKQAINEARIEAIKECAEAAKTGQGEQWRKDAILKFIDQVK